MTLNRIEEFTIKVVTIDMNVFYMTGIHIDDDEIPDVTSSCCSPVFPTQPPEIVAGKRRQSNSAHRKASPTESNSTVKASNSHCNVTDDHRNANGNNCGTSPTTSSFAGRVTFDSQQRYLLAGYHYYMFVGHLITGCMPIAKLDGSLQHWPLMCVFCSDSTSEYQ